MPVQIQELELVPPPPAAGGPAQAASPTGPAPPQSGAPSPELERRLEHAARLRRARDQRLQAD